MDLSCQNRKTKCKNKCCVTNCCSRMDKDTNLSFHALPKTGVTITRVNMFGKIENVDKRAEWLRKLNKQDVNQDLFVCSKHFKPDDYYLAGYDITHKVRRLLKSAVPSLVNESESQKRKEAANVLRKERCARRELILKKEKRTIKNKTTSIEAVTSGSECNVINCDENVEVVNDVFKGSECDENMIPTNVVEPEPPYHDENCEALRRELDNVTSNDISTDDISDGQIYNKWDTTSNQSPEPAVDDDITNNGFSTKSVQVNSDVFLLTFSSFIKSESDLITMCNIKSFSILDELTKIMNDTYPVKRIHSLSTRDSIILTTAKLKLDISFSALAVLFNSVTEVTIRNTFYDTVKKLATILQCVISRVSKDEIKRNMPQCFNKFQETTSVLDCTEIKIQTPKCLKCKIKFYSHYKSHLTVKFMTEVTPAGLITYVSESFGGRESDKAIFNHSGILKHLESTRDAVMVDRGFLIDDECLQKRIKLIRPPFMKNKKQLSEAESIENKKIACARVHIERVNQRIKQFQILNNNFPWHMINYIDDIFVICCGLVNLETPVLADDKF